MNNFSFGFFTWASKNPRNVEFLPLKRPWIFFRTLSFFGLEFFWKRSYKKPALRNPCTFWPAPFLNPSKENRSLLRKLQWWKKRRDFGSDFPFSCIKVITSSLSNPSSIGKSLLIACFTLNLYVVSIFMCSVWPRLRQPKKLGISKILKYIEYIIYWNYIVNISQKY